MIEESLARAYIFFIMIEESLARAEERKEEFYCARKDNVLFGDEPTSLF
jgi:hypothetical protein